MRLVVLVLLSCVSILPRWSAAQGVENFTLEAIVEDSKTQLDTKFEFSDHKGKTVVLHFLLKTECPFCLKYTNQYAQLAAVTPDVIHLFIKPDSERDIRNWIKQLVKIEGVTTPTIYRDADASLAKRFGIPDGYVFHGQRVHYPAMIVIGEDGTEMFRYVGKSNKDRMPIEDFKKKLMALKKK